MSAYLCSQKHVGALASYLVRKHRRHGMGYIRRTLNNYAADDADLASLVASRLAHANIESVATRYPNDKEGKRPGPNDVDSDLNYVLSCAAAARRVLNDVEGTPVRILKACDCFEYQACEYEGWKDSIAHQLLEMVRAAAIRSLPGYDDAAWGWKTSDEIRAEYREAHPVI